MQLAPQDAASRGAVTASSPAKSGGRNRHGPDRGAPARRAAGPADPIASARQRFTIPDGLVYLDGNSLGAMPADLPVRLAEIAEQEWGRDLIGSWNTHDWGAPPSGSAPSSPGWWGRTRTRWSSPTRHRSTSSRRRSSPHGCAPALGRRHRAGQLPSDLYVIDSVAELLGLTVRQVPPTDVADTALGEDVAMVSYSHKSLTNRRRQSQRRAACRQPEPHWKSTGSRCSRARSSGYTSRRPKDGRPGQFGRHRRSRPTSGWSVDRPHWA